MFFNELEKELPPILSLKINAMKSSPQLLPQDPLYVLTQIFEDSNGTVHPITNEGDMKWLNNERENRGLL